MSFQHSAYNSKMNLKIDRLLPYPPTLTNPYILCFINMPTPQLLLYSSLPPPDKPQQPKKKFAFKVNVPAAPTVQTIHLFDISSAQWRTQQTRGKFPTRRDNPTTACMGPCLMLYGGTQINPSKVVNDLYGLNLTTWQWKKLFAMEAPPAHPNTVAVAIAQDKLAIVNKTVWIFEAKEVIWNAQSTDLPGGIWKKVKDLQIPFQPKCAYLQDNQIVVFGFQKGLRATIINYEQQTAANAVIEGQFKGKGQTIELVTTSENKGILVDGCLFGSFFIHQHNIFFGEWAESNEAVFDKIVAVQTASMRNNLGITQKKELASVTATIEMHQSQEDMPNTARQVTTVDVPHQSSFIEQDIKEDSNVSPYSPLRSHNIVSPLSQHLSALLAKEWLRRRVLEEKGRLLEETIKKAQKMVIVLCRYGDQQQKRIHIAKVCKLRQSLYRVFQSQSLLLQKMAQNPIALQLREKALRAAQGSSSFLEFSDQ